MSYSDFIIPHVRATHQRLRVVCYDVTAKLTAVGTLGSGSFTLTFDGATTQALDWDATAAEVQAALEALQTIPVDSVACSGGPLNTTAIVITFSDQLSDRRPWEITADGSNLVGTGIIGVDVRQVRLDISTLSKIWFTAKRSPRDADADAVFQCTLAAATIALTSGSTGEADIILTPTTIPAAFPWDEISLYWDLKVLDGSGNVRNLAQGRLVVIPDSTRAYS